ncbi:MAG: hypothetical protein ACP5N2_07805 [Candidatus Nanoarchaeia archaeon]
MESLKRKILEKKELRGIPSEFLDEFLKTYEKKHKKEFDILKEKQFNEKSKEFDDLKKQIRKKLRELHGVFSKNTLGPQKKKKLIFDLKNANKQQQEKIIKKILLSHQSTFERYDNYKAIYSALKETTPNINKILDLGCGYNPFSYDFLNCTPEYVAIDINEQDSEFIKNYFEIKKIKGKTLTLDLTREESLKIVQEESQNSDVCLLLKLLDSLESKKRGSSLDLLNHLNSRVLVVSFPLKTIGGRKEIKGERKWFDRILKTKKYDFNLLELDNEKYYVIKQKNS